MFKPHLQKGIIHVGLIVLVLVGLTVAATVAISASGIQGIRPILPQSITDIICKNSPSFCPQNQGQNQTTTNQSNTGSSNQTAPQSFKPQKTGPCYPLGDANTDYAVNDGDAQFILWYVAHKTYPSQKFNPLNADVNGDGQIDSVDAQLIRQYITGQINTFPACELVNITVAPGTTKPIPCGFYGDINPDGLIDKDDVKQDYLLSIASIGSPVWADVDRNGKVNPLDAKLILQYLKGEISTFPACATIKNGTTFSLKQAFGVHDLKFSWSGGSIPKGTSYTLKVWGGDCNQENQTVSAGLWDRGLGKPVSTLAASTSVNRTPSAVVLIYNQYLYYYCAGIYDSLGNVLSNPVYFNNCGRRDPISHRWFCGGWSKPFLPPELKLNLPNL